jgi:hypothetical protein
VGYDFYTSFCVALASEGMAAEISSPALLVLDQALAFMEVPFQPTESSHTPAITGASRRAIRFQ